MPNITIAPDQLENLVAQLAPGTITSGRDASYDPHTGLYTYSAGVAEAVEAAYATLANGQKMRLRNYAAAIRFSKEIAGVTVDGHVYPSDRDSQPKFTAAVVMAQINTSATFNWKLDDGAFVTLDAAQLVAVASAIGAYVQRCFSKEASVKTMIDAGTITITSEIDAAFAVI